MTVCTVLHFLSFSWIWSSGFHLKRNTCRIAVWQHLSKGFWERIWPLTKNIHNNWNSCLHFTSLWAEWRLWLMKAVIDERYVFFCIQPVDVWYLSPQLMSFKCSSSVWTSILNYSTSCKHNAVTSQSLYGKYAGKLVTCSQIQQVKTTLAFSWSRVSGHQENENSNICSPLALCESPSTPEIHMCLVRLMSQPKQPVKPKQRAERGWNAVEPADDVKTSLSFYMT